MRISLLVFFWAFAYWCKAQELPSNSLDDIYTPTKGSILDMEKYKNPNASTAQVRDPEKEYKNQIGISLPQAIRGMFALNYGRVLNKYFGVEAGIGVSFMGDWVAKESPGIMNTSGIDYFTEPALFQQTNSYLARDVNPYFHLTGRFYFEGSPYSGSYLGLNYRFYQNNYVYGGPSRSEARDDLPIFPEYKLNISQFALLCGFVSEGGNGKLLHDAYAGFGIRRISMPLHPVSEWNQGSSTRDFDNAAAISPTSVGRGGLSHLFISINYILQFCF